MNLGKCLQGFKSRKKQSRIRLQPTKYVINLGNEIPLRDKFGKVRGGNQIWASQDISQSVFYCT